MSDWLMSDDSADGGYLGMDDPAMPDAAPAPPSAPTATATAPDNGGDWLGGDSDWLGGAPTPQEQAGGTVMDSQGEWLAGSSMDQPAVSPGMAPPAPAPQHHQQYQQPAPMAQSPHGEISVMSPQLQQVNPSPRSVGGARGELSDLVLDVEVQVEVGLGNAALTVEEFLEMGRGSVVELDTPIDAPIELKVRGKLIARGQLVSINGSYGMRIIEMLNEEH
jgi:flagellar motor switch protein FliN/FliY